MKKLPNPTWTTTVYPDEYDYLSQFSRMVKLANKNKEIYCEMDVGKVWGLVLAYKEAQDKMKELAAFKKNNEELIIKLEKCQGDLATYNDIWPAK